MKSGSLLKKKTRVIQLHEVDLSGKQENKKKAHPSPMTSDKAEPEKAGSGMVKKIFDAIVYYVNQSNFEKAQQLYDRLVIEIPTAVNAIVKAGEIIEQRKRNTMDPEKIRPWADLFNQFTDSEAAAFYFALTEFTVKPNQPVFQQGNCDNRLYFINSGRLKLKYFDYNVRKNVPIATLQRGDIAGVETFFTFTNHTTNLIAAEESKISYIDKADYQKIVVQHHGIESKLLKYCEFKQSKRRHEESPPKEVNRRAYQRYKTQLAAIARQLDSNDRPAGEPLKAKIVDISVGGLGFCVKSLKIGDAACLHNSRLIITATYAKYGLSYELKKIGTVVSLKFHPLGECSVHIQFEEPMDEDRVMEIAQHVDVIAYI